MIREVVFRLSEGEASGPYNVRCNFRVTEKRPFKKGCLQEVADFSITYRVWQVRFLAI